MPGRLLAARVFSGVPSFAQNRDTSPCTVRVMRYPHLTARLFNVPLLIHPQKLDAIIAGLGSRLLGATPVDVHADSDLDLSTLDPKLFSTKKGERAKSRGYKVVDGVAVINVNGALVHRSRMEPDSSFLLGYNDIAADVEDAQQNTDVHAVVQVFDSPGGEAQGAFEFAQRLFDLRGKKPMVSVADGLMASAAYLAGSAADEVVVTGTGYAGSIGVVMRHVDFSRALANEGINVTHIYAGAHKVDGNPYQALPEAVRADFQAEINDLYDLFVGAVSRHTGLDPAAVRATEAATFRGAKAVRAGLASRIGHTDQIIAELASRRSSRLHSLSSASTSQGAQSMDLKTLRAEHPALVTEMISGLTAAELASVNPALADSLKAEGAASGVSAERARVQAILGSESAAGRAALAQHLAFSTAMSVDDAKAMLDAAPKEAMGASTKGPLFDGMAKVDNPDLGADPARAPDVQSIVKSWDAAFAKTGLRVVGGTLA